MKTIRHPSSLPPFGVLLATLVLVLQVGCTPEAPERVWVPAEDFEAELTISVGDDTVETYTVNQWIFLHATRTTGPWKEVAHADLPEDATWLRRPPPDRESEVEAKIHWRFDPDGSQKLNMPTPFEISNRRVLFERPGRYRVWAEGHTWGGGTVRSEVVEVTVGP